MESHVKVGISSCWRVYERRCDFALSSPLTKVMGLLSKVTTQEGIPVTEEPVMVRNVKIELIRKKSYYPAVNFHKSEWINYGKTDLWAHLTSFILDKCETQLHKLGLYKAIRSM